MNACFVTQQNIGCSFFGHKSIQQKRYYLRYVYINIQYSGGTCSLFILRLQLIGILQRTNIVKEKRKYQFLSCCVLFVWRGFVAVTFVVALLCTLYIHHIANRCSYSLCVNVTCGLPFIHSHCYI